MIQEIIKNRRAIPAKFMSDKEIPSQTIRDLLESANWAPNHKQTEPWRFKVYRKAAKKMLAEEIYAFLLEKSADGHPVSTLKAEQFKTNLERVPAAIAIIVERDAAGRIPEWEEVAAVAMSVQNIWLTATDMGLGVFWASPAFLPLLHDVVKLTTSQKLLGFLYLGFIRMEYPSPGRGAIEHKVQWFE